MRHFKQRRRAANSDGPCQGFGTLNPSENIKIQGYLKPQWVFATYRPVGASCPSDCKLLDAGCYAQVANVGLHQRRAGVSRFDPVAWAATLPKGSLIRWNVSGDVVGPDGEAYRAAMLETHTKRPDLIGWTYTHAWRRPDVAAWARTLPVNLRCVASLDDVSDRARAHALGFETVAHVVSTEDGKSYSDSEARDARRLGSLACPAQRVDIGCADCLACMRPGSVAFAAHGSGRLKVRDALRLA